MNIGEPAPKTGCWIVVKTVRGLEMALLGGSLSQEQETKYRSTCFDEPSDEHTRGPEPMLQEVEFVELANPVHIQEHYLRRSDEERVLVRSRQILHDHQLQMKLVDVEYTMDRKKLFFYFTSEQRIDFRAYVRDLAREFRIRIEMRQIGVRDEAKTVRGISPCGRACCCSYWLHRFTPINIRMVKEQNLALNPTKISGICGRLMCCMAYEHSHYSELWRSLPNPGSKIKTPQGNYVLEGVDLQRESVKVRFPEGREVPVPIAEFADFKDTVLRGETWKEEAPAESLTRRALPFRPMASGPITSRTAISPKTLRHAALETQRGENAKDPARDAKNDKKFKPEKISLEEHIAVRIGERIPNPPRADAETSQEAASAKKRPRRRKSGKASGTPASKEKQNTPSVKEGVSKKANPPRPPSPGEPVGEAQKGVPKDPRSGRAPYRPHARPRNPERGRGEANRERPGGSGSGSGKESS
jgi:cell fate regulator YaaT (PSP1 superfamily)